jgi:hypothetical protein
MRGIPTVGAWNRGWLTIQEGQVMRGIRTVGAWNRGWLTVQEGQSNEENIIKLTKEMRRRFGKGGIRDEGLEMQRLDRDGVKRLFTV